MGRERYRRLTELFVSGEVLVIEPVTESSPGMWVWLQKMNQFEVEEARRDAGAVRSRVSLALRGDVPEMHAMREAAKSWGREGLIRGLLLYGHPARIGRATTDVQSRPLWQDKMEMIFRSDLRHLPPEEVQVISDAQREYLDEVDAIHKRLEADDRAELEALDDPTIRDRYIEEYIEGKAADAFLAEMKTTEVFFGVRACDAEWREDGPLNHSGCQHDQLYERAEVRTLPDRLFRLYSDTLQRMTLSRADAKGSARRLSSSAPSRPPSEEGESTASTPEVTSLAVATT